MGKLGRIGTLDGYVSIGDQGKMVLPLRSALGLRGEVWVVNDSFSDDIPAVLERGCVERVGHSVAVPALYGGADGALPEGVLDGVPACCCDLVTINQGLHHLPPASLPRFLRGVRRMLRPGGIFIVREHDATPELVSFS